MGELLQALADGLLLGGLYALLAAGLALIFGVMKIINFAQGAFLMMGMYAAYIGWASFGLGPFVVAIPIAAIMLVFGGFVSVSLLDRIPRGNQDAQLLLTLGVGLVIENLVLIQFGAQPQSINVSYSNQFYSVGGLFISQARLYSALAAVVVMLGLQFFLNRTWVGRALRATSDDVTAARGVGINVRRMDAIAFGTGTALAGLAGALLASFYGMIPTVGQSFIIIMFVAVVLGGMGSIGGAIIGAVIIGLIQSFSVLIVPLELQSAVVFGVFILVLLYRPYGVFGARTRV